MNFKKLLILGLILIAASTALSAVTAADGVTSTSSSKTLINNDLTMNNIHFKIPDGFEEVEKDTDSEDDFLDDEPKAEDIDGTTVDAKITSEFKKDAEKLEITVGTLANDKKIESINPSGFEQKSIAGKDGFVKQSDDGKEVTFEYLDDGKLVKIVAPSEDMIGQILA